MFENNRDEINFHKFLKSVRKSQGVTLEKTTYGVGTKSGMSRVEAGTRLPDKLVRDRLTARLGISGEEYEEYLLPPEYEQWQARMEIIRCINKKDVENAEEKIQQYAKNYGSNCVEKQFVSTMTFMVYQMKGCSDEVLRAQIYDALICTVPDIDEAFAGVQLLADQELNLIMEYVRLAIPENITGTPTEWRLKEYHKIVTYVENSRMDKIAQAKVYSKVSCFISDLILKEYETEESLRYALELCTRSIEVLRDTVRLYYFVELNEYRMKLIERLRMYVSVSEDKAKISVSEEKISMNQVKISANEEKESEDEANRSVNEMESLDELYRTSEEWANLFHEMYTENEVPVYMENFTHLYTETECNSAVDVIRIRRKMMGTTRRNFSSACSVRSLQRLELKEGNSSMSTVREVFERIGLCAEYKRARVVTSDVDALHLSEKLIIEMNSGEYKKAYQTHRKLCKKIDLDIPYNEQEMRRAEALILRGLGKISQDEHREILIDTIECTLALDNLMNEKEKYLSRTELSCVQNLALQTGGKDTESCRRYLESLCIKILEMQEIESARLCVYELIMVKCANRLGDEGKHFESKQISKKLLKESLRNRRMMYLTNCEYNILWNDQKIMENNKVIMENTYVQKYLTRGLMLSTLAKISNWKMFFQQKLQKLKTESMDE